MNRFEISTATATPNSVILAYLGSPSFNTNVEKPTPNRFNSQFLPNMLKIEKLEHEWFNGTETENGEKR